MPDKTNTEIAIKSLQVMSGDEKVSHLRALRIIAEMSLLVIASAEQQLREEVKPLQTGSK